MNPGSPTPQAGILDHSSPRTPSILHAELTREAIRRPQPEVRYKEQIDKTIVKATIEGKAKNTIKAFRHRLNQLSRFSDLMNPTDVKQAIGYSKLSNSSKCSFALAYEWFTKANGLKWEKPYFKWERKIPLIPTTENINKIISASSKKYATLFTILTETGLEGQELSNIQQKDIDTAQGIITATGCKGHNSRSFKLKPPTAEMLREYLTKYTENKPFPNPHALGEAWRNTRNQLAKKLNQPELRKIPMRNLRHHFATMKYDQTKDILLVKQLLGHKKLETTMFYTQLITFAEDEEYTTKATTDNKEAQDLLDHGFTYQLTTPDGTMLFRKRKT